MFEQFWPIQQNRRDSAPLKVENVHSRNDPPSPPNKNKHIEEIWTLEETPKPILFLVDNLDTAIDPNPLIGESVDASVYKDSPFFSAAHGNTNR